MSEFDRALRAQEILADPLVKEAFETIRHDLMTAWANSPPSKADDRERLYALQFGCEQFRAYFERVISGASVAEYNKQLAASGNLTRP